MGLFSIQEEYAEIHRGNYTKFRVHMKRREFCCNFRRVKKKIKEGERGEGKAGKNLLNRSNIHILCLRSLGETAETLFSENSSMSKIRFGKVSGCQLT
jgi:transcriptional antiterminator Rof (Rho-off)